MFFLHYTSVCFYVALSSVVLAREADKQSALHDSQVTRDTKHIKEHLKDEIGDVKEDELSDQDLLFHYFRLHDYDSNRKLDGLELMQAMNDYHKESGVEDEKETSEEAVAYTVDRILKYDDTNNDGYIDYPEYINAQGEHLV